MKAKVYYSKLRGRWVYEYHGGWDPCTGLANDWVDAFRIAKATVEQDQEVLDWHSRHYPWPLEPRSAFGPTGWRTKSCRPT